MTIRREATRIALEQGNCTAREYNYCEAGAVIKQGTGECKLHDSCPHMGDWNEWNTLSIHPMRRRTSAPCHSGRHSELPFFTLSAQSADLRCSNWCPLVANDSDIWPHITAGQPFSPTTSPVSVRHPCRSLLAASDFLSEEAESDISSSDVHNVRVTISRELRKYQGILPRSVNETLEQYTSKGKIRVLWNNWWLWWGLWSVKHSALKTYTTLYTAYTWPHNIDDGENIVACSTCYSWQWVSA